MFRVVHSFPDDPDGRRERIAIGNHRVSLAGALCLHDRRAGLIVVPIASGDLADASRDAMLADALRADGFNTLLLNLLVPDEAQVDRHMAQIRQQVRLLADRLVASLNALRVSPLARHLHVGIYASGSAAAVGICAAAEEPGLVRAIVSRSGRPDLAQGALQRVATPMLLIVGQEDHLLKRFNERARAIASNCELDVVPGASRAFDGPATQAALAERARDFFDRHLPRTR